MCAVNLSTTRRSVILDTKFRFEIGLNYFMSNGSSVGFLIRGRTKACLCQSGKNFPSANDILIISVITGHNIQVAEFFHQPCRHRVQVALLARCFLKSLARLSTSVSPSKRHSGGTDIDRIAGGGALAVVARMVSTFPVQWVAKSSAERRPVDESAGSSSEFNFFHRVFEFGQIRTVSDQ